jgi:hypothetical protein
MTSYLCVCLDRLGFAYTKRTVMVIFDRFDLIAINTLHERHFQLRLEIDRIYFDTIDLKSCWRSV